MKPTKIRNYQIYRAPYAVKSNQVGSPLSEELRKKYGKRSIRVVVDDSVRIIRGEYKGIDGKVTKVSIMKNSVAIEGIKRENLNGQFRSWKNYAFAFSSSLSVKQCDKKIC